MAAVVEARDLRHSVAVPGQNRLEILRGVNLTVQAGESVAVMGRSGSGKTTLLSVLGLLTAVRGGNLRVVGEDVTTAGDRRRSLFRNKHIGFVFQSYSLVRHLSAYRNIELPLLYGGRVAVAQRRAQTTQAMAAVGLSHRAASRPRKLSGGEQQRAAIARALVREPALILADEPTGALDVDTAKQVLAALRSACRDRDCALIVVTHDDAVADQLDRVAHLSDGRLA